ncbi:MAG: membrane protein insertion efficiency factor YidD [Candidatus Cloacimonetes bacterium]|nr:membrane protein insertion efficiency factor YidD [Candidatus Cloacimonadota bacterium]
MNILNRLALGLIGIYRRYLSPLLPDSCRFEPTCSIYSQQAFRKYNFIKAFYLSLRRLLRCHPFHPGGFDPLP